MRVLFSAVPAPGHVLPLIPLMEAAVRAGHEVALLSGRGIAAHVPGLRVFEVGPSVAEAKAETARRLGGDDGRGPGPGAVEMFGAVRVERAADHAIEVAREFGPQLVVHDTVDAVGPLTASALGVGRVEHRITGPLPLELLESISQRGRAVYDARGLSQKPALAVVDPFPDALLTVEEIEHEKKQRPERFPVRAEPYGVERAAVVPLPVVAGPAAVVTLGTSVREPEALATLVSSIAAEGCSVLTTVAADELELPAALRDRVHAVGFVPLSRLLPVADVVVSAGGTGTLLAALAMGKPMVIRPFVADQPWNAERAARIGAAVVIDELGDAGAAVRRVLQDDRHRKAAAAVAAQIAQLDDADTVLARITGLEPFPGMGPLHSLGVVTNPTGI